MRGDLVGEELALRARARRAAQSACAFSFKQREIHRAAADHFQDFQQSRERRRWVARSSATLLQQARHQLVQAPLAGLIEPAVVSRRTQFARAPRTIGAGSAKPSCAHERARDLRSGRPDRMRAGVGARILLPSADRTEHRLREMSGDTRSDAAAAARATVCQSAQSQRAAQAAPRAVVFGQLVRLLVVPFLQAILDDAQKAIDVAQLLHDLRAAAAVARRAAATRCAARDCADADRRRRVSIGKPAR